MEKPFIKFHPLITGWFMDSFDGPTDIQEQAWPLIASGEHVLITAPTGSGKTLTAFLWALNQLASSSWPEGRTSVLYVSPLKALNNDIKRNLLDPLGELRAIFADKGESFPPARILTRSGDTPPSDRRRMQRHPPEILITTPESLNLLLSSHGGRSILTNLKAVILDEIHSVIGTKRGTHLITAVDRLVLLSGEFQRIALSATQRPLEAAAGFIGGIKMQDSRRNPTYAPRPVSIIRSAIKKHYEFDICSPPEVKDPTETDSIWNGLASILYSIAEKNRSTLFFANSRRLTEKLTLKINNIADAQVAYAHHGSLSREIRTEVERKLKAGELKAIVATSSLELGIDIGALDEVVLIQSPPAISSAIQRLGRAGHHVGKASFGKIFPTHPRDILEAAVLAEAIPVQDIEEIVPVENALDVLAQTILSMTVVETWDMDELFNRLRTSYPYRNLSREHYDLVIEMLGGRYAGSRIRELGARLTIDRLDNTVRARRGAQLAVYLSGGVIADRGYFQLRHEGTGARIGELDEEFVWEAKIGQAFTFGTQSWRVRKITHNEVLVQPVRPGAASTPFWRAESRNRDFHFSEKIGCFLEAADQDLEKPGFAAGLASERRMDESAASGLVDFLLKQKKAARQPLPHRHHVLIEHVSTGPGGSPGNMVVLHTIWGGRVNQPFALVIDAAWEEKYGKGLDLHADDDCISIVLPHKVKGEEIVSLVVSGRIEELLRKRLEASGFFGARFRECAGTALLLTRPAAGRRMPLWMSRLKSQKLMKAVSEFEDFPVLLEAWRTCLLDQFDIPNLKRVLEELATGETVWSETETSSPSPMARTATFRQVNQYMYKDDEPRADGASTGLSRDLLDELVFTPGIRPAVNRDSIDRFENKRQRLHPGYSPSGSADLLDWLKERILLPEPEWERLIESMMRDHGASAVQSWLDEARKKLVMLRAESSRCGSVAALERVREIVWALYGDFERVVIEPLDPASDVPALHDEICEVDAETDRDELAGMLVGEWLSYYGPCTKTFMVANFGTGIAKLSLLLEDLLENRMVITGSLVKDEEGDLFCDSRNYETLLRLSRSESRSGIVPLPPEYLSSFLAAYQGIAQEKKSYGDLLPIIESLECLPAPAGMWESEIFPARAQLYSNTWIDSLMAEKGLHWIGGDNRKVAFCFESDLDLMMEDAVRSADDLNETDQEAHDDLFPDTGGRYDFATLRRITGLTTETLSDRLWEEAWKSRVTNDTFHALRRGIVTRFRVPAVEGSGGDHILFERQRRRRRSAGARSGFSKCMEAVSFSGNWMRLPHPVPAEDSLETEERKKDRVRILLDRYGVIFRELLAREYSLFSWQSLFRTLRLMELSGEITSGYFFDRIPGPQFASHGAIQLLRKEMPDKVFWINAADPASLCGLGLDPFKGELPRRIPGNHIVYHGARLVFVSEGLGKSLTFKDSPGEENLSRYTAPLDHLLRRQFRPLRSIKVMDINAEPAISSPYIDVLKECFEVHAGGGELVLYKSYKSSGSGKR